MRRSHRKTTPKVVDGRVQRKHRNCGGPSYVGDRRVAIERRKPGYEYRHVVTQNEVYAFIQIVPDWEALTRGLGKIILDEGSDARSGWFSRGVIALCAFPRDLRVEFDEPYFYRDLDFFRRLAVPHTFVSPPEPDEDDLMGQLRQTFEPPEPRQVICQFSKSSARCYVLMRTLLHELGHHLDLATNRKRWCSRGEEFAERIGRELERRTWANYCRRFGNPA